MDTKAKHIAQLRIHSHRKAIFPPTALGTGTITIANQRITSSIQQSLYHHVTHTAFVDRLSETLNVDHRVLSDSINWISYRKARKNCSPSMSKFITKWLSNTAATGTILAARRHRLHSNCPICDAPDEDALHVLTCPSPSARIARDGLLQDLRQYLTSIRTHPAIANFLISGLHSWFLDPFGEEPLYDTPDRQTFDAISQQLDIGWYALLCGYITNALTTCQHDYYKSIRSRKPGSTWSTQVTAKLWFLTHSIWTRRNEALHNTERIDRLSGITELRTAISAEHTTGQSLLPMPYSPFFYLPLPTLLRKSTTYLKHWFMAIRSARERFHDVVNDDQFVHDPILRAWTGLPPSRND